MLALICMYLKLDPVNKLKLCYAWRNAVEFLNVQATYIIAIMLLSTLKIIINKLIWISLKKLLYVFWH